MKYFLHLLFLTLGGGLCAQVISPDVLNSAGAHQNLGNGGASITYNVGEPFIETIGPSSNVMVTQGFVQPMTMAAYLFTVTAFKNDVTCADKDDGRISTALTTAASAYQLTYLWNPSTACPGNNCTSIDSLRAGRYDLKVIASYLLPSGTIKKDTIADTTIYITDANGPCKVKIFTGVNIDGGSNGHLHIENISEFPNNRLTIYNRWGGQLYDEKGYDNITKFWPGTDELSKLLPSTYFYVLDLGDGSKPIKGWVELIKN
jgi:gliding motility-associated-like protein